MLKKSILLFVALILGLSVANAATEPSATLSPNQAPAATLPVPVTSPATTVTPAPQPPEQTKAAVPKLKVGYADLLKIGSESDAGLAIKGQIKKKTDTWQGKINSRKKQIEKLQKSIQGQIQSLTQQQREAKAKEFEKKVEDYQKFVMKAEKDMQEFQEQETRKLYVQIEQAARSYGKEKGYTAIVVKKDLLYLESGIDTEDVTDAILKLVNEQGKSKK
jgi:outer membrane protein